MLDGYGSRKSTVQPQQLVWENVAINSILAINNLTQPNSTNLPQLIRIPILIFDYVVTFFIGYAFSFIWFWSIPVPYFEQFTYIISIIIKLFNY